MRAVMIAGALSLLAVAAAVVAVAPGEPPCTAKPRATIDTAGGAEDLVTLALADGRVRLFFRDAGQISYADLRTADDAAPAAALAWRPRDGDFDPLGISLVDGPAGSATLYVTDRVTPARIWRLPIVDGRIGEVTEPWARSLGDVRPNDIQAVGDDVYVTHLDAAAKLPGRPVPWHGVVRVRAAGTLEPYAEGLRGANGIIDLDEKRLLVSDYWSKRLRYVSKDPGGAPPAFATRELPIHPDNLTRDGSRVLIAGQRSYVLAFFNVLMPFVPSPSAVLSIDVAQLKNDADPVPLWEGGVFDGRSVSVAVPVPGGLALGQVRAKGVLVVRCAAP
jgi:hypothetical protein